LPTSTAPPTTKNSRTYGLAANHLKISSMG
jgi:hypothetical protein